MMPYGWVRKFLRHLDIKSNLYDSSYILFLLKSNHNFYLLSHSASGIDLSFLCRHAWLLLLLWVRAVGEVWVIPKIFNNSLLCMCFTSLVWAFLHFRTRAGNTQDVFALRIYFCEAWGNTGNAMALTCYTIASDLTSVGISLSFVFRGERGDWGEKGKKARIRDKGYLGGMMMRKTNLRRRIKWRM